MEGEKKVILLNCCMSPFGAHVKIALARKGVAYEERDENLSAKSPLLLASNPVHKKVPVLLHDGKPVCESLVIVEYIENDWAGNGAGAPALLPADPYACAQARFWVNYVDTKVCDCGSRLWRTNGEALDEAEKEMVSILRVLEGELGGKAYFGGGALGIVDVALVPFIAWFHAYEQCTGFSIWEACPVIAAWARRCVPENESVAESLPDPRKVYDEFVRAVRRRFGLE